MRVLLQTHALSAPSDKAATAATQRRILATRLSSLVSGPAALGLRLAFLPLNRATRSALLPIRADSSSGNRAATPAGFSAFRSSVQPTVAPSAPENSQTLPSAAFASVSSGANFGASTASAIAVPTSFQAMAAAAGAPVFTPWSSLFGGVLIGVAATLHLLMSGRIMGASGIINGAISGASDWPFRVTFLASMIAVGCAAHLALPSAFGAPTFAAPAQDPIASVILPAVAGVLAGFGSQLGSGCTSGHGVCGLPRLSIRSLMAVCTFKTTPSLIALPLFPPCSSLLLLSPARKRVNVRPLSVRLAVCTFMTAPPLIALSFPPAPAFSSRLPPSPLGSRLRLSAPAFSSRLPPSPLGSRLLLSAPAVSSLSVQLGSGCTSGHGVCGLPRLSIRSLVAVCTFMTTGAIASMLSNALLPPVASAAPVAPPANAWMAALSGAALSGAALSGAALSGAALSGAALPGAALSCGALSALPCPALPCLSRRPALPIAPPCWSRVALPCPRAALLAAALLPAPPCCAQPSWPPSCPRAALLAAALPCRLRCPALATRRSSLAFDTWLDDFRLYLLSDSRDSVSLFDHTSGASLAPPATTDSATRSQWLTRDAAARLAVRNHLPLAKHTHFGQHKTAKALYDAVLTRYSSPATAALGRLILSYLFPELSAFATVEDLITHLRTTDTRYCVALPAEFLDKNPPPMYIILYFIVTRLPDSLRAVRDHFLALDPTDLTVDLLEQHLLAAESLTSGLLLLLVGSAAAARARVARVVAVAMGVVVVEAVEAVEVAEVAVGVVAGVGASVAVLVAVVGVVVAVVAAEGVVEAAVVAVGVELFRGELLAVARGSSSSSVGARPLRPSSFVTGLISVGRLGFGHEAERPRWLELLRSGVDIFALDYDAILPAMYALSVSAEGDCYLCVPPDPGIEAASLGASESALPGTAPAEALHTFIFDSGASRCFFRDSTTLTPLPAPVPVRLADPSGGLVLAHSSTVLPCLADAMVTTTTPGGQRVSICTCARTCRHLATFTRRPRSSLYTLTTEPTQIAAFGQVSASSLVAAPCSCRLLSQQTLLWNHRLGHPSLPCLCGMHSRLLASGLPRSLPPLPPSPAPPCLPCVEGRHRAAPHSSSFPLMTAPLQTLHMDVWGPARVSRQDRECYFLLVVDDYTRYTTVFPLRSKGQVLHVLIPWIRLVRLQLRERFREDLPVLRLHSNRGGEFSSDLLRDFCRGEGILRSFMLPTSPQQNEVGERHIGLVMDVARTSMIHAAAPHFLWSFAVRYAACQLNL
ncbi:unnamed protein product [Closterium sp. NIES-54]